MFDDEEEDQGFMLLVLGVLAAILLVVTVVARSGDDLPAATVTGPAEEVVETTAAPTTTEAPETTTTEAETTTTAAPTTTEAAAVSLWNVLTDNGETGQLAAIAGPLGLQDFLSNLDGEFTLFAPSDAALGNLDPATLNGLLADPEGAAALLNYHVVPGRVGAADVVGLADSSITSTTGLPINITLDADGNPVLNGVSVVTSADLEADNGIIHVIDTVLSPPTVNEVIGLENIEFEVSSANITAAGQDELQKAIAFFTENDSVTARIEGHTDTDGGEEGNLALSQARADAVLTFLVDNGIDEGRLTAIGFGETNPILVDGVEDKAASRRIEFVVR